MTTPEAYLADKPKLRAAIAALERAIPEIGALNVRYQAAVAERQKCMDSYRARLDRQLGKHGVRVFKGLPGQVQARLTKWVEGAWAKVQAVEDAARSPLQAYQEALEAAFADVEDADVALSFKYGQYWRRSDGEGIDVEQLRDWVQDIDLKALFREYRKRTFASHTVAISEVQVDDYVFFEPGSLYRVARRLPSGMVDMSDLLSDATMRVTPKRWPKSARRLDPKLVADLLAGREEWERRKAQGTPRMDQRATATTTTEGEPE